MKKIATILMLCISLMMIFTACGSKDNTIQNIIVSDKQYTKQADIEHAKQQTSFSAGTNLYASIYFIESPKGMKYTAKWFLNNKEIEPEEKEMVSDKCGIIIYSLEADKVAAGKLKLQIVYGNDILYEKEFTVR